MGLLQTPPSWGDTILDVLILNTMKKMLSPNIIYMYPHTHTHTICLLNNYKDKNYFYFFSLGQPLSLAPCSLPSAFIAHSDIFKLLISFPAVNYIHSN